MLTLQELRRLQTNDPSELYEWLELDVRQFLFGVVDQTAAFGETWGGSYKLVVNQNVVVEFVPCFTEEMHSFPCLPQFTVMPHTQRHGVDQLVQFAGDEAAGLDPYNGVVFLVKPEEFAQMQEELSTVTGRYEDFMGIPDTWFLNTRLVHLISKRVLEHSEVRAERRYDFSKQAYAIFKPPPPEPWTEHDGSDLPQ